MIKVSSAHLWLQATSKPYSIFFLLLIWRFIIIQVWNMGFFISICLHRFSCVRTIVQWIWMISESAVLHSRFVKFLLNHQSIWILRFDSWLWIIVQSQSNIHSNISSAFRVLAFSLKCLFYYINNIVNKRLNIIQCSL